MKLVLSDPTNLINASAIAVLATNHRTLEEAFENTLSRDGTSPNSMLADLDLNSHRILNLLDPVSNQEPVTLAYFNAHAVGGGGGGDVASVFGRIGSVVATAGDYNFSQITGTLAASQMIALTGDVTRPSGSVVTTLANIPNDVPMAGDLLATATASPGTPVAGKARIYVDSTQKVLSLKNDAGTVSITVVPSSAAANQFASAISAAGVITWTQPSFTNLSGTAAVAQLPLMVASGASHAAGIVPDPGAVAGTAKYLREDATWAVPPGGGGGGTPGGATTLLQYNNSGAFGGITNLSSDGTNPLLAAIAAPATPAAGFGVFYLNSTNKVLSHKNDAGTVSITVVPSAAASSQFATAISAAGVVTWTQPSFSDLSGTAVAAQLPIMVASGGSHAPGAVPDPGAAAGTTKFLREDATWAVPSPGLTGPGSTVKGAPTVWSGTAGGSVVDGKGMINALAYGADPTGVADSQSAIQTALDTGRKVYLPKGSYLLSASGLTIGSGGGLIGDGMGITLLTAAFASGTAVTVSSNAANVDIKNLTISRSTAPSAGSYGINMNSTTNVTANDNCVLENLYITGHHVGLRLGSCDYSFVTNVQSVSNASHGILIDGAPGQWQLTNVLAASNGGDGFHCDATLLPGSAVGQWRGLASYTNSGYGFYSVKYANLRVSDSFFGSDGLHEVYIGTGGDTNYEHVLTNVITELSATGYGFMFDAGLVGGVSLVNCVATANKWSGVINNTGGNVSVVGGNYYANGTAALAGNTYGLLNYATGSTMSVVGVRAPAAGAQTKGVVSIAGTTACTVVGCNIPNADISNSAGTAYSAGNY